MQEHCEHLDSGIGFDVKVCTSVHTIIHEKPAVIDGADDLSSNLIEMFREEGVVRFWTDFDVPLDCPGAMNSLPVGAEVPGDHDLFEILKEEVHRVKLCVISTKADANGKGVILSLFRSQFVIDQAHPELLEEDVVPEHDKSHGVAVGSGE